MLFFVLLQNGDGRESQWHEMLRGNVFYVLDLSQFFSFYAKCHQKTTHIVHGGLWGVSEK